MTNTAKAAPEKAAGKKTLYCKDCKHYNKMERWCDDRKGFVARKNFCENYK